MYFASSKTNRLFHFSIYNCQFNFFNQLPRVPLAIFCSVAQSLPTTVCSAALSNSPTTLRRKPVLEFLFLVYQIHASPYWQQQWSTPMTLAHLQPVGTSPLPSPLRVESLGNTNLFFQSVELRASALCSPTAALISNRVGAAARPRRWLIQSGSGHRCRFATPLVLRL